MSWKARLWVAKRNLNKYLGKSKRPRKKFTQHVDLWRLIKDTSTGMFARNKYNFLKRRRFYG